MAFLKDNHNKLFLFIVVLLCLTPVMLENGVITSGSYLLFLGKCICFAIVGIGIDLIWGYTGILSLGHGLYFSLGGYGMAMYLKLQATGGKITDFMYIGGMEELPAVWLPFKTLPVTVIMVMVLPAIVAGFIGYFIFKNRVKGVYFSIISQALTWAAYSIFIALSPYTNGNTGITEIKSIFGTIKGSANYGNMYNLLYLTIALLVVVYLACKYLTKSKFGKILVAIRDGENRTRFSGYKVANYKNFVYVLSASIAGIAGALFVNFNGGISPSQMTISYSIMMVIWVAIGGRGTLVGAVLGAFIINLCEYNLSSGSMVEAWQYIIGGVFCITIIFFKGGIVGSVGELKAKVAQKFKSKKAKGEEVKVGVYT